jgi:crotonobetainyl-CoA:carnitine CoA-transferase CaiB-like acyl-CoA transferase
MFIDLPCPGTKSGGLKVSNTPIRLSRTPPEIKRGAPDLGQYTEEVLSSLLGMSQTEIASLKDEGVLSPRIQST